MPAINFKPQFTDKVRLLIKRQTFRLLKKRPSIKPGDRLYLYTGMRTKECEKLAEVVCAWTLPAVINPLKDLIFIHTVRGLYELSKEAIAELAYDDGFESTDDFFDFLLFQYGFGNLDGQFIGW